MGVQIWQITGAVSYTHLDVYKRQAYRYVTIYKAKAAPNEDRVQTKGGSINFQTNGFALKGSKRFKDGRVDRILDDDDPNLPAGVTPEIIAAKWFTDVEWVIAAGE